MNLGGRSLNFIYIPLWLDLLCKSGKTTILRLLIYIPLWLDLLLKDGEYMFADDEDLHSTMVRFIMFMMDRKPAD